MPTNPFRYNTRSNRYIDARGRIVSQMAIDTVLKQALTSSSRDMHALTRQLAAGDITIQEWQTTMAAEIKASQLASAALAKGGFERMTQADYGRVGQSVREQYAYLQSFAQQLANGAVPLDGRLPRRAELYVLAAKTIYHDQREADMRAGGATEMRRETTAAESCPDCLDYAAQDWQPIGSMPSPGDGSVCRSRCQCTVVYR